MTHPLLTALGAGWRWANDAGASTVFVVHLNGFHIEFAAAFLWSSPDVPASEDWADVALQMNGHVAMASAGAHALTIDEGEYVVG